MSKSLDIQTIAKYIKSERVRLELTQTQMADLGGVSKATQLAYETGVTKPDAVYLSKIRKIGVDTELILSGTKRSPGINWQLIEEIIEIMAEWQNERADPISTSEHVRLMRILYSQFCQNEQVDDEMVDLVLGRNAK